MRAATGCHVLATAICFLSLGSRATAQIEGFTESFSGTGDYQSIGGIYDGLDNPDWAIGGSAGTEGVLTEYGFEFVSDSISVGDMVAQQELRKRLIGQSSFSEEVRLRDLSLGEITEDMWGAYASITIEHFFSVGDLSSRVSVALLEPPQPDEVWRFSLWVPGESRTTHLLVPRSDDLVLSMTYDHQSSMFSASYEPDVSDGEPPIELALPLNFELSAESEVRFRAATDGQSRVTGVLNLWSLTPLSEFAGDFNGNGLLDAADIDQLSSEVRAGSSDLLFDLNADAVVDDLDRQVWVHELKQTYFGDADLNGAFDSTDLVQVLASGEYEDDVELNSTWLTGDWNGDGEFTSGDLVVALADGGYETGAAAVPEPSGAVLAIVGFLVLSLTVRRYVRTSGLLMS